MSLLLLGASHRTAPVEVRERLAFTPLQTAEALPALLACPGIEEALILSTCNRTELYLGAEDRGAALAAAGAYWARRSGMEYGELSAFTRTLAGREAARHLFRVAAGLDSLVLGETQIQCQVKQAYALAQAAGSAGHALHRVCQQALRAGKKVRAETGIDQNPVSIPYIAIELTRRLAGGVSSKRVLILGAGKMCRLALNHLRDAGAESIIIASRTYENALALAEEHGCRAARFSALPEHLARADIVLAGTSARHAVLPAGAVAQAMKGRPARPLILIDIAVPRDIEPAAEKIPGVTLKDVDDLKEAEKASRAARLAAARRGERIIAAACNQLFVF
ncbi:MAG: glutamyl-tRNA reductase [Gracilibacteraceae bacterium]|jgi:glutamyl-tRNA reductase|nr:glutamyl-tRNA reductase [Gracilibacteraceae bacterium]